MVSEDVNFRYLDMLIGMILVVFVLPLLMTEASKINSRRAFLTYNNVMLVIIEISLVFLWGLWGFFFWSKTTQLGIYEFLHFTNNCTNRHIVIRYLYSLTQVFTLERE